MRLFPVFLCCILSSLVACTNQTADHSSDQGPTDMQLSGTLSNLRISSITEDADGYIWFGTSRGLNRFGGNIMHQYFCNDGSNAVPDNRINTVFCDSKGRIWITTKNGIARYTDQDDFEQFPINSNTTRCQSIVENSRGDIFVSQTDIVLRYDTASNSFEKAITGVSYLDPYMLRMFIDDEDNLWIVDDHNVDCYSTLTLRRLEHLNLPQDIEIQTVELIGHQLWLSESSGLLVYDVVKRQWVETPRCITSHPLYNKSRLSSIIATRNGNIIFCSNNGLFLFDPIANHLLFQDQPEFPFSAPDFVVTHALSDSRGNLWLCSESQGFVMIPLQGELFNHQTKLVNSMSGKPVVSLALDRRQTTLWMATLEGALYSYDLASGHILRFAQDNVSRRIYSIPTNINRRLYCVFADSQDNIWVSTTPKGLAQLRRRGNELEYVNYYNLPSVIVLREDLSGTLWAGCYGNSYFSKRKNSQQFVEHHLFSNTFSYLSCLEQLSDGRFATLERELGLRYVNPETQEPSAPVIPDSVLKSCIARNLFLPSALKEGRDGRLWIGTVSNGLMCYDPKTQTLENVKGAPCEDIASIEIDREGDLWVSTQYGLGKYSLSTKAFTNYYSADGLGGNEYFDRSSCQLPDGTLIFGGAHGVTVFNPADVADELTGKIQLEDLKVHNQLMRPRQTQAIDRRLDHCQTINLDYDQSSFSISFSAFDFSSEERYNYQYQLEGFNHTWVDANSNREAFYANIKPGKYVFRARVTNKDRDTVLAEASIPVIVHPAIWGTWWAILLYLLVGVLIIVYIVRLYRSIRLEKKNRLKNQREKEQERRINQMNMNFFANVSHEFRTPLTVISGPIKQLCQDASIPAEQHRLLKVVNRSVTRMLQLVNQMMDFHKLEDDTLKLEVKRQDIVGFLRQVAEFFAVNARDKSIDFRTHGLEDVLVMWADLDKMEKILNNLLGNAMKYTPAGGRVDLTLDVISGQEAQQLFPAESLLHDVQYVKVSVTDNGQGIPADQRLKVFQRYYQLRNAIDRSSNWGTGIGLYFTQSLVKLHHGQIGIFDNPDGKGANFCFVLPASQSAYNESEISDGTPTQNSLFPIQNEALDILHDDNAPSADEAVSSDKGKPHLVVVDDDIEVIHYLKLLLGRDYQVTCRFDATTALETLRKQDEEVDLVISDVMMPGTTGFQLCQQIKADEQLCHLPVILVTAKNTVQDQIEGLQAGAMAYVTKPFDPAYLQALIQRLLGTRDQTRKVLQESTQTSVLDENALSSQDKAFMNELYRLMEEELANPDMDVSRLTDLLHVSRSKLYYKIKGLTGENPSSFFKTYKLNRAAELIREGKYNLSEISLLTGFSTLSHFSTSFKRHFGVAPSEY